MLGIRVSLLTLNGLSHLVLPAVTLSLYHTALIMRLTRAGVREVVLVDFIKFAHAKGLTARRVVFVHLFKNILIPVVTVLGLEFGGLLAYGIVTETIFAWPGMGKLLIDSINILDRPVVVAYVHVHCFAVHHHQFAGRHPLLGARSPGSHRRDGKMTPPPGTAVAASAFDAGEQRAEAQTPFRRFLADFTESRTAVVAFFVFVAVLLCAIFAPWISPTDPYDLSKVDIIDNRLPPGSKGIDGITYWARPPTAPAATC